MVPEGLWKFLSTALDLFLCLKTASLCFFHRNFKKVKRTKCDSAQIIKYKKREKNMLSLFKHISQQLSEPENWNFGKILPTAAKWMLTKSLHTLLLFGPVHTTIAKTCVFCLQFFFLTRKRAVGLLPQFQNCSDSHCDSKSPICE